MIVPSRSPVRNPLSSVPDLPLVLVVELRLHPRRLLLQLLLLLLVALARLLLQSLDLALETKERKRTRAYNQLTSRTDKMLLTNTAQGRGSARLWVQVRTLASITKVSVSLSVARLGVDEKENGPRFLARTRLEVGSQRGKRDVFA